MAKIIHTPADTIEVEGAAAFDGDVSVAGSTSLAGPSTFNGTTSMAGNVLEDLGTPVVSTDATNKTYVDNAIFAAIEGLSWKAPCRVATTANITLSGLQTIDGIGAVAGNRVLVKDQSTTTQNGIYVVAAGAWSRSTDANTTQELDAAATFIESGTVNTSTSWVQTTNDPVIGVDPIVFILFGSSAAKKAATFVVSQVPLVGDYADIQSALNNLPAEGGLILVREGTYALTSTLTFPNKPVILRGCGQGTIISFTTAIAAITLASNNEYGIENLKIRGTGIVGQVGITDAVSCDISMFGAEITNVEKPFLSVGGFTVTTTDCHFEVPNLATAFFSAGFVTWNAVNTVCDFLGGFRGGFSGDPDLHWSNSSATLINGAAVGYVTLDNCSFTDGPMVTATQGSSFSDCAFMASGGGPTRCIDLIAGANSVVVTGCQFSAFTSEAIRIATSTCTVTGNIGCKVTEVAGANANKYTGNKGFSASTIFNTNNSIVDGTQQSSISGSTTGGFVGIMGRVSVLGMVAIGTIKNTGANSMEVRELVTDLFGVSDTQTTTVLAGNDYLLDAQTNFATARPPYTAYQVDVRHPGAATTYSLRHVTHGAEV